MTGEQVRVALVMDHPAQQFTRAFELLSGEPGVRLRVFYWSAQQRRYEPGFGCWVSWDVDMLSGYRWAAPPAGWPTVRRLRWFGGRLRAFRPDVVVCYGWATPIVQAAIVHSGLTRTPLIFYSDSTWQYANRGRRGLAKSAALRMLMSSGAGAVATGVFNREFYIRHGMHPGRIWPGVCPADTDLFGRARTAHGESADGGNARLRIGFAGKLTSQKGVDELLRAAAALPRSHAWSVSIVGDGPQLTSLRALARRLAVADRVTFHGFANTTEMPALLAGLDVVVVPSRRDRRVLVTIEAMAAGAAVVVSDATAVWGAGDLVEDGVTGLVYRSGDPAALAGQLRRLLDDPGLLAALREAGTRRAAAFGPASFARTMASAARMCALGPDGRARPGWPGSAAGEDGDPAWTARP
jgi:glycosyltransferase involved in cell wall biosynthesis